MTHAQIKHLADSVLAAEQHDDMICQPLATNQDIVIILILIVAFLFLLYKFKLLSLKSKHVVKHVFFCSHVNFFAYLCQC